MNATGDAKSSQSNIKILNFGVETRGGAVPCSPI